jgi:hypothetical protein
MDTWQLVGIVIQALTFLAMSGVTIAGVTWRLAGMKTELVKIATDMNNTMLSRILLGEETLEKKIDVVERDQNARSLQLERDIMQLRLKVAEEYIDRDTFTNLNKQQSVERTEMRQEIMARFTVLEDKIDRREKHQ